MALKVYHCMQDTMIAIRILCISIIMINSLVVQCNDTIWHGTTVFYRDGRNRNKRTGGW